VKKPALSIRKISTFDHDKGMFEAELKYRMDAAQYDRILAKLKALPGCEDHGTYLYHDQYFDDADRSVSGSQREVRLRTVIDEQAETAESFLTYKHPPFDQETRSKEEEESPVQNPDSIEDMLEEDGYYPYLEFEKHCHGLELPWQDKRIEVALVRIDGIKDHFIELEILEESQEDAEADLSQLRAFAAELGLGEAQRTSEYYTDMVAAMRASA